MSPQVPVGFPFDLTDSELAAQLDVLSTNLANGGINESLRWGPLVQLGLNEQQNRETKKSNMLSRRVGNIALFVSFVSLIFTVFAAYYAREASTSSDRWEKAQTERLDALRGDLGKMHATVEAMSASTAASRGSAAIKPRR